MKNNDINKQIKKAQMFDKFITAFIQILFVIFIVAICILSVSCDKENEMIIKPEPCYDNCGKLITKFHHRELQTIDYTYVTNCNDTLISTVILNEKQLGIDNGITYFINTYSLKDYYCE